MSKVKVCFGHKVRQFDFFRGRKRDRRREIKRRNYDPGSAEEIRTQYGLENIPETLRRKRLTWVAEVLRVGDEKVTAEMERERRENGRWWRLVKGDLTEIEVRWDQYVAAVHRGDDIKAHLKK